MNTGETVMRQLHRWIASLFLLLAAVPAVAARDETDPARFRGVRYEIHYMDLHAAEVLAWDQCPEALKDRCQVSAISTQDGRLKYLDVVADSPTHERIAHALSTADAVPRTQVFQAVLLAASNRPGTAAPDLSPGAQKALADVRGFLPYKSYEPLDATLLRTTRDVEGRLLGRDGRQYSIWLHFKAVGAPDSKDLFIESFRLREEAALGKPGTPPRVQRDLISTSFGLKQGETIVVGTSKSEAGDEALVLLLTAVP
jgi:hypothetical protein